MLQKSQRTEQMSHPIVLHVASLEPCPPGTNQSTYPTFKGKGTRKIKMTQTSTFWEGRKIGFPGGYIKNKGAIEKSVYFFFELHFFYVFRSPTQAWLVHTQTDLLLLRSKNQFKVLGSSTVQFQVEFGKICRDRNHQHIGQGV